MIIYGSKGKQLGKEPLTEKCLHCGSQNTIDMHVVQRYLHIFWIPFIPLEKTAVSSCSQCQQVLKLRNMPPHLITAYQNIKAKYKTPAWMFVGLGLVGVLIAVAVISNKKDKEEYAKLVLAPKTGDLYEVKTPESHYTLMKIIDVQKDSVYVRYNNYETDKASGIYQLKDKAYSEEVIALKKAALKIMFEKDEIYRIERH